MDKETLVKLMEQTAKRDLFCRKGRIIINEFLKELEVNPKPTALDLIKAWNEVYPFFPIEQKMNVLIISFEV